MKPRIQLQQSFKIKLNVLNYFEKLEILVIDIKKNR